MKADLHVHTHHSGDNRQSLEEIFEACKRMGIGAVAITDHNSIVGAKEAMEKAPEWLLVLPGIEITSADGHILAYNVEKDIPRDRSAAETIDLIHQAGGIAVAAHPYRIWSGLGEDIVLANRFDAVEVLNGRNTNHGNARAGMLVERLHCPFTAGSDAHRQANVGDACLVIPDDIRSKADMVAAIMDKRAGLEGHGRTFRMTVSYGSKAIAQWARRGFRRL